MTPPANLGQGLAPLAAALLALVAACGEAADNRLRNGSFEGGLLYWHGVSADHHALVRDAKAGEHALRLDKAVTVPHGTSVAIELPPVDLNAGNELVLLPEIDGMYAGDDLTLSGLTLSR